MSMASVSTSVSPLIVFVYGNKRIMARRPATYEEALNVAARHFGIPVSAIQLQTRDLDICQGVLTDISSDSWFYVRDELRLVQVARQRPVNDNGSFATSISRLRFGGSSAPSRSVPTDSEVPPSYSDAIDPEVTLHIKTLTGKTILISLRSSSTLDHLSEMISNKEGFPPDQQRLIFSGKQLEFARKLTDYSLQDGSTIYLLPRLRGDKPIIYLNAPEGTEMKASVKLSLIPSWRFSAIYPLVPIQEHKGQTLEWSVTTKSDGTLHEHSVDVDVAYLFWEATTTSSGIYSPPPSPRLNGDSQAYFDPALANVTSDEGVMLSVEKELMSYLDKALTSMGLHVEARTSFITYWLPSFLKHRHVALRFVNQEAYERCAPLEITPAPDVVTRVYMVFKGVSDEEAEDWSASCDASLDPSGWSNIVGVDEARARDTSLFRVLEWGGMECF